MPGHKTARSAACIGGRELSLANVRSRLRIESFCMFERFDPTCERAGELDLVGGGRQRDGAEVENWDVPSDEWPSQRSWEQQGSYEYEMRHPLRAGTDKYSAEELMDIFKSHPSEIFPFTVKGNADGFTDGAVFELSETLHFGLGIETGEVAVTTTDTSVKFTVISDGYFDGPGSTIEFSIVEDDGQFFLRKVADAHKAQLAIVPMVELGASFSWEEQAFRFQKVLYTLENGAPLP